MHVRYDASALLAFACFLDDIMLLVVVCFLLLQRLLEIYSVAEFSSVHGVLCA